MGAYPERVHMPRASKREAANTPSSARSGLGLWKEWALHALSGCAIAERVAGEARIGQGRLRRAGRLGSRHYHPGFITILR